ncbi:MAG: hypothetical protein COB33_007880 [Thiotrichaceae bacterium]|nr:hypothetical protein [Thiotrichaceae bacterium]
MSYRIDASLQQGIPSLRFFDARSGKERLFWQQPETSNKEELRDAWRALFRHLALLSCIDRAAAGGKSPHITRIKRRDTGVEPNVIALDSPYEKTAHTRQSNVVFLPLRRAGAGR